MLTRYRIESSEELRCWVPRAVVDSAGGLEDYLDSEPATRRFYRVALVP